MNAAKKIIKRAPRYTFSDGDEKTLFFAREKDNVNLTPTELIDISASGAGLIVALDEAPQFGEMLKVEFTVPGMQKMAWWARVVRVSEIENKKWWMKKSEDDQFIAKYAFVALNFKDLPSGHKNSIRTALHEKFLELQKLRRQRKLKQILEFINENKWKLLAFMSLLMLSVGVLYFLSQPSANYDPKRGSPWGQRFDMFRLKK